MSKNAPTQSSFGKLVAWHVLICEEILRVKGALVEKTETKTKSWSKIFLVGYPCRKSGRPWPSRSPWASMAALLCEPPPLATSPSRFQEHPDLSIDQNDLVRLKKRLSPAVDYQKTKKEIIRDLNKSEQQRRFPVNHRAQCSETALSIHNYTVWLPW